MKTSEYIASVAYEAYREHLNKWDTEKVFNLVAWDKLDMCKRQAWKKAVNAVYAYEPNSADLEV